ncbi:N(G),N(G)-dimethylarginine dimethylaminohydrolase 1-like [Littorina saxatilis]|uniref:Dimethylargininase n=1 Tax=Littorina saxatilis TaxID=31220 RepID=A0AAN9BPH7_9CAEN
MHVLQLLRITASGPLGLSLKHFSSATVHSKTLSYATSTRSLFNYTHAITRGIPKSFVEHSLKMDTSEQIVLSRALEQMKNYIDVLKRCGLKVITLPADERYPDCLFVEDAALVIGQKACLTRPGHPSRRGEVQAIKEALENLGIKTQELDDPSAMLDGGDIIFTGQEILVGESERSNRAATESLQRVFPEFPVTSIPICGMLHLKSVATLAREGVITVGGSEPSQEVLKLLKSKAKGQYKYIQLSHDQSANVVFINGNALIKPESEIGSSDFKVLTTELQIPTIPVEFGEFYKADGCLSCCSLLLQVP